MSSSAEAVVTGTVRVTNASIDAVANNLTDRPIVGSFSHEACAVHVPAVRT
jgi:hypothetical protein